VYVDGKLIIDKWFDSDGAQIYTADVNLGAGAHNVTVEYYEHGAGALVKVGWERLQGPSATPTVTQTRTQTQPVPASATPTRTQTQPASVTPTVTQTRTATQPVPPSATPTATGTATVTATPTATLAQPGPATATPTATVTQTATLQSWEAAVSGRVWADQCPNTGQTWPTPDNLPQGCVLGQDNTLRANSLADVGEPGLAEVQMTLVQGQCGLAGENPQTWQALTNAEGRYTFTGLTAGNYCLVINPTSTQNAPRLGSGLWTRPAMSAPGLEATVMLQLTAEQSLTGVDLGWDVLDNGGQKGAPKK